MCKTGSNLANRFERAMYMYVDHTVTHKTIFKEVREEIPPLNEAQKHIHVGID